MIFDELDLNSKMNVFSFLRGKDLARAAKVSKTWLKLSQVSAGKRPLALEKLVSEYQKNSLAIFKSDSIHPDVTKILRIFEHYPRFSITIPHLIENLASISGYLSLRKSEISLDQFSILYDLLYELTTYAIRSLIEKKEIEFVNNTPMLTGTVNYLLPMDLNKLARDAVETTKRMQGNNSISTPVLYVNCRKFLDAMTDIIKLELAFQKLGFTKQQKIDYSVLIAFEEKQNDANDNITLKELVLSGKNTSENLVSKLMAFCVLKIVLGSPIERFSFNTKATSEIDEIFNRNITCLVRQLIAAGKLYSTDNQIFLHSETGNSHELITLSIFKNRISSEINHVPRSNAYRIKWFFTRHKEEKFAHLTTAFAKLVLTEIEISKNADKESKQVSSYNCN